MLRQPFSNLLSNFIGRLGLGTREVFYQKRFQQIHTLFLHMRQQTTPSSHRTARLQIDYNTSKSSHLTRLQENGIKKDKQTNKQTNKKQNKQCHVTTDKISNSRGVGSDTTCTLAVNINFAHYLLHHYTHVVIYNACGRRVPAVTLFFLAVSDEFDSCDSVTAPLN